MGLVAAGRGMKQQVLVATGSPAGVGRGVVGSAGLGRTAPQQLMVATSAPRPRPGQVAISFEQVLQCL